MKEKQCKTLPNSQPGVAVPDSEPNEETKKAIENARKGASLSESFDSVETLLKSLCSEDEK